MASPGLWLRAWVVFVLTMAMLALEVALTRVFSYIMHYHFTYLAISVAMLGFGAAGAFLTVRRRPEDPAVERKFLADTAALLAVAAIAAIAFIPRLHFYPMDMYLRQDYSNLLSLLVIVLLASAPFFFGGTCIAYLLSQAGADVNRVYFADLAGAAAGCLLVIVLVNWIGAVAVCFAVAALALVAAILLSPLGRGRRAAALLVVVVLTAVVARREPLPLYVPRDKQLFGHEDLVEEVHWHVITRLDVTRPVPAYHSFGGALSWRYTGDPQTVRFIFQDASALTGIIQPTPSPRQTASLGYYLQGAPYRIKPGAEALVIGCGGGADILIALHHGARRIVGVDVNPDMIELVRRNRDFLHGAFPPEEVELVSAEGRHFLSRDARRFDVIQLSGVDTFSALATGAYALTENFIYTTEALRQYLAHLKPGGIVNISRPLFTPPRETLKLIAMWMEVLEGAGAERPPEHLVILSGRGREAINVEAPAAVAPGGATWAQTLVKQSPFTPQEVRALAEWADGLGFEVVYDPFTRRSGELEALARAGPGERQRTIAGHVLNIRPATDDQPFFFRFHRWDHLAKMAGIGGGPRVRPPLALIILLGSLGAVALLSAVCILYPLYRHGSVPAPGGRAGIFAYFAALGLAFILIEIALIQKLTVFLGGPTYSMSITLFTILLASGVGSFLSRNWSARPLRLLAVVVPLLVLLVGAEAWLLNWAVPRLMGLSHPLRALAAVAMLAPLAILMGMPFPAGLRQVNACRRELNPWAWGINACATVMGAVLCILIASSLGFTAALLIGGAVYLAGWVAFAASQRQPRMAPQPALVP